MAVLSEKEKQELALNLAIRNTLAKKAMGQPEQIGPTQAKANAIEAQQTVTNNSGGSVLPKASNMDVVKHSGASVGNDIGSALKQTIQAMIQGSFEDTARYNAARTGNDMWLKQDFSKNEEIADQFAQKRIETAQQAAKKQAEIDQKYNAQHFSGGQQLANESLRAIGGVAPALISGVGTPYLLGLGFGAGTNQAINEGATLEQATDYGVLEAGKEVAIEKTFGGLKGMKAVINPAKVTDKIGNKAVRTVADLAIRSAGEGVEEGMAAAISPQLQRMTYNPNAENATWEEILHNAMIGAIASGGINVGVTGVQNMPNATNRLKEKVHQKDQNRAFEALHGQKMGQNQVNTAETAQNDAGQAIVEDVIKNITNPNKASQKQSSKAEKQPTLLEMSERTFDNVADKNVLAYQQQNPEIKPYQQEVAEKLLYDLQMGEKGRREVGIDAETRTVTTMHGIKRNQSEPINRMRNDGLSYNQIEDGLSRIIEDEGSENTPNAKRVELYVHDAMRDGYKSIVDGRVDGNRNYSIRNMSVEELETEAQRLTAELSTVADDAQGEQIASLLDAIDERLEQLRVGATTRNNGAVAEESSTVDYADYDINLLDEEVRDFYEQVGELGEEASFKIRIVTDLPDNANGMYDGKGNILIKASQARDIETFRKVVSHEVYHRMKNTDEHKQLQDLAYDLERLKNPNITRERFVQNKIDDYYWRSRGKVQLDTEAAWDEIGADIMDRVLNDKALAEQIWTEAPSLAARIIRAINDLLQKFKNRKLSAMERQEAAMLRQARDMYINGLQSMKYADYADGDTRYMFAGENSRTADREALARAQQMEAIGADMENIRQATGWFKSKVTGGKWAYEIDDSKADYTFMGDLNRLKNDPEYAEYMQMENNLSSLDFDANPELEKRYEYLFRKYAGTGRNNRGKASDFVSHDALFEAYPQLAEMNWYQKDMKGTNGSYTPRVEALDMNGFVQINKSAKDPMKTSLHEMQHAIQEIEGFPGGSSAEYWNGNLDAYQNTAGEIMARDTAQRRNLNAEQRRQKQPAMGDENTVYANGGNSYNMDTGLKAQFDKWLNGGMKAGEYFTLGRTPESLKKFGAKDLPIIMTQDVIVKITGGKHSIALDEAAKLPDQIANPIMLFKGSIPNSFVVLTEIRDKAGNEVVSAIHLNKKQDRLSVNRIASLYGKNNIENYVKTNIEDGNLLDVDTKKAPMWFSSRGLQLPKLVQTLTNAKNIVPESQLEVNDGVRYSLDDLIDEHGAIPPGENPTGNNRNVEVPNRAMDGKKVRRFVRTIMESPTVDDAVANMFAQELIDPEQILSGVLTMESTSNKTRVDAANESISDKGWKQEYQDLHSRIITGDKITAQDIALATRVVQEAQKAGDAHAAFDLLTDLTVVSSELGQGLQAVQILKRLSPEGQLMSLMKTQKRINDNLRKQKRKPVSTISEETAAEFLNARSIKKRDEIWNREIARMAQETQGTWADKINALRYAAMLSNPKTHIRNIIGNFVMQAAYVPRNIISGGLQDIKGGEKTHSVINNTIRNTTGNTHKELWEFAKYDYHKEAEQVLRNIGNRYDDVSGEFESQKKVFGDSLVGRGLEQLAGKGKYSVGSVLDAEDMVFKQLTYQNALIGYMKANGISVKDARSGTAKPNGASIAKGRKYAFEQARKATFTEDNIVADWLSKGEREFGAAGTAVIGSVMPFKKTPLNILSRGVEFSPVGAGMTAYKLYYALSGKETKSEKTYDVNDVMDSLGANLTGSGILALGMYLASQGLLVTTGDDDEERKARYDQQMGDQNFAVVNPETGESWTIDWLAPSAMPLLTGVEVYRQLFGDNDDVDDNTLNKALESASKIADPVFEMSCMQGVASALASYSGDAGDIASSLMSNVATGIAGQFVPQPMAALARTIDDTVRSSYAPKDSNVILGKTMESFLRQQRSKIPVASYQNEPSIDVWGNERKREFAGSEGEEILKRTINNFINPATYSTDKRTELDKELEALYKKTGNAGVLPKTDTNYVEAGNKTYHKTPEEKTAYDKFKGQKSQKYVSDFVKSGTYKNLDNSTKAEIVVDLYNLAGYEAKKAMLTNRGVWKKEYENARYENVLKSRTSPAVYYAVNGKLNGMEADKDKNGKSISGSRQDKVVAYLNAEKKAGRITDEQWWYFYTKEYSSQAKNAPYAWIREANK